MSGKGEVHADGGHMGEKEKMMFLLQKVEVWNTCNSGMSTAAFRHHYRVNKSMTSACCLSITNSTWTAMRLHLKPDFHSKK
jgi:hypothetical protein